MNEIKLQNRRYLILISGAILSILIILAIVLVARQKTAQNQAVDQCISSPSPSPSPFLGSNYPVNKETLENITGSIFRNCLYYCLFAKWISVALSSDALGNCSSLATIFRWL